MENIKNFDQRLKSLLTISGAGREELAGSGPEGVLAAVDDAVCAVIGAACAAYGEVLPLAEQFSHIAGEALSLCGEGQ